MKYAIKGSLWIEDKERILWELDTLKYSHHWHEDGTDCFYTLSKSRRYLHTNKEYCRDALTSAREDRPEYHWKIVRVK